MKLIFRIEEGVPITLEKGLMGMHAASILAKTHRDEIMQRLNAEFPGYDWAKNKAYPTPKHRAAIRKLGTTPYHRMSYDMLGERKAEKTALIKAIREAKK